MNQAFYAHMNNKRKMKKKKKKESASTSPLTQPHGYFLFQIATKVFAQEFRKGVEKPQRKSTEA
jgi:hypothetical protein